MAGVTKLFLLGPIQVEQDGQVVSGFESRKALALLAYLAVRAQPAGRAHLADLFWPDLPEARGRANLSGALHNLNARVPGCIAADRNTVVLDPSAAVWLDTRAFGELERRGLETRPPAAEDLAAAADLYRDAFLADLCVGDCADFELWLVRHREEWRARVIRVLAALVDHHARRGEHPEGLRFAARLLEIEPWNEEAHGQLMALLAGGGQRSAALAQFEICRRALDEELGVAPGAETVALYQRIRAGPVTVPAPPGAPGPPNAAADPPHNLPAALTSFVGRAVELASIADRLGNPACRLLTLAGPGGVGKTRLAVTAADAGRIAFPDGVFLVALAPIAEPDLVVPAVADALGVAPSPEADPRSDLIEHLRHRRVLLVMDAFEHVLPAAGLVIDLLRAAPGLKVLATSRERLNLQAEWLMPVQGLDFPADEAAEPCECSSAVRLFVERARQVDPGFTLGGDSGRGVVRICRSVEGLPLAIELAATRVRETGCLAIANEIAHGLDALATTMRDVPARHRSLRAVVEQSWVLLSAEEQRAFARLSVFRGGFSATAAGVVACAPLTVLASLQARFLIRGEPDGRYDLHPLLRQFATEKLTQGAADAMDRRAPTAGGEPRSNCSEPGPAPSAHFAAHQRHAEYFLAFAEAADTRLAGPDVELALREIATEVDNLRAALTWAEGERDAALGLRLCGALARAWQLRGELAAGRRWIERFLSLTDAAERGASRLSPSPPSPATCAKALAGAGALAEAQGDYDAARTHLRASLAIWREIDDRHGIAAALNKLGNVANLQGDACAASSLYRESLSIARAMGDPWATAAALNNLGNVANFQGDYDEARRLYGESLDAFRAVGDPWAIAVTLNNLGLIASEQGDLVAAKALLDESLELARELGDRQGVADALQNAGDVACRQRDVATARRLLGESLAIRREIGDHQGVAWSLESLASLAKAAGEADRAACLLGAAAALRATIGAPRQTNEQGEQDQEVGALRAALGEQGFDAAYRAGRGMDEARAADYALGSIAHDSAFAS